MKIKNTFSSVLFFSFLFAGSYCFCQHPQGSTNNKIKAQSTPAIPTSIASSQKQSSIENSLKSVTAEKSQVKKETATGKGEPGILQDVKRVSDEHQELTNNQIKAQSAPTTPTSIASYQKETATGKGEASILQDVKRVSDEHALESSNNQIKAQSTPTRPTSIALPQRQLPIANSVKSSATEKSQVNKVTATGKGEPGILQDVKRVSDEHP